LAKLPAHGTVCFLYHEKSISLVKFFVFLLLREIHISVPYLVLITGKSFTGKFAIFFFTVALPVKMLPVTGKFKGFKLDPFASFYLKLAMKTAVFSPKLQVLTD
jgi:hypothetical protein